MTKTEIVKAILDGQFSAQDLLDIGNATRDARKFASEKEARVLKHTLKAGDKVRLSNLRPKYINGAVVEVEKVNQTRVEVKFGDSYAYGKYRNSTGVTVPLTCITPV